MATKYGTAREITETKRELDSLRSIESDPNRFGTIQDKSEFRRRKNALESRVSSITPPPVASDAERKSLLERRDKLESFIKGRVSEPGISKPEMPSKFDQWETPSGAIGKHRSWEDKVKNFTIDAKDRVIRAPKGYGAVSEWKDIQRRLTPLEEQMMDPDTSNVESLRSQSASSRSLIDRPSMSFAQGANVSPEQWKEVFGDDDTPKYKVKKPVPPELQCTEIKKDGSKCTGKKVPGKDYCLGHSGKHKNEAPAA